MIFHVFRCYKIKKQKIIFDLTKIFFIRAENSEQEYIFFTYKFLIQKTSPKLKIKIVSIIFNHFSFMDFNIQ